jgi:allantoicase
MSDFTKLPDLASERLGGRVLQANDEFFAPKENLLKPSAPVFIEHKYTACGKWMDGWETRRRRTPGYDWCIIRLGLPGILRGVVVDTSFFTGNYPERFSLEACDLGAAAPYANERKRLRGPGTQWSEILPQIALKGDSRNRFDINELGRFTHLRLRIYPDGGVARLRVHGDVSPGAKCLARREIDLAAIENGGRAIASSDEFYGAPLNLLMPGRAKNMGDGWETKRRRGPGNDWVILQLGVPGDIRRIEVDTNHFKGNFPDSCSVESCYVDPAVARDSSFEAADWHALLSQTKLKANDRRIFSKQLQDVGPVTHVRLQIYPDGGVSRLRVWGRAEQRPSAQSPGRSEGWSQRIERFNALPSTQARKELLDCCGSNKWAEQVLARRPFANASQLRDVANDVWRDLERGEWLAAFRHHPAIGAKKANAQQSSTARRWSAGEQSNAQKASPQTLAALAAANEGYRAKFGYVFLICASEKTSEEILAQLRQRMSSDPAVELKTAAEEQRKIMQLRLEKLSEL